MRNKLLSHSIAATLATLALAGCGRDADSDARGSYVTGAQQSTTGASVEPAPVPAPAHAVEPAPVLEYADVTRVRTVNDSSPIYGTVVASEAATRDVASPQQV